MERREHQPSVSHSRGAALVAGSAFMALSGVVLNTLPIVLGAAADSLKLSNLEVGYLGSAYLAGFAGTPLLAPLWIRRIPWRVALALGILVLVLSSAWAASTHSFSELAVALFVTGTGAGALFSVAVTALGESAERERAFVASETTSLLLAAVAVWTLPTLIIPKYGFPGVAWALAAATAAVALLLKWHPRASVRVLTASRSAQRTAARFPVFLALVGIGFYHVGLAGLWSLLERIGRDHQISAQQVSEAFSLEKVLVLVMCAVAYCQGARLGHRIPVLSGCAGMLISASILYQVNGELGYIAGVCLFGVSWTYCFPFQLAIITEADYEGRYSGLIPAFMGIGLAIGPGLSGLALSLRGYLSLYGVTGLACVVGAGLLLFAARRVSDPVVARNLRETRSSL